MIMNLSSKHMHPIPISRLELPDLLNAVEKVHELMHERVIERMVSYLKLETRTDKVPK